MLEAGMGGSKGRTKVNKGGDRLNPRGCMKIRVKTLKNISIYEGKLRKMAQ